MKFIRIYLLNTIKNIKSLIIIFTILIGIIFVMTAQVVKPYLVLTENLKNPLKDYDKFLYLSILYLIGFTVFLILFLFTYSTYIQKNLKLLKIYRQIGVNIFSYMLTELFQIILFIILGILFGIFLDFLIYFLASWGGKINFFPYFIDIKNSYAFYTATFKNILISSCVAFIIPISCFLLTSPFYFFRRISK